MPNNFIERLDLIADPTGSTGLSNTTFFSNDGLDTNAGDPNNPKKTIGSSTLTTAFAVIGSDVVYSQANFQIPIVNSSYVGDGMTVIDGEGLLPGLGSGTILTSNFKNFIIKGFTNLDHWFRFNSEAITNCIFVDNGLIGIRKDAGEIRNCLFIGDLNINEAVGGWAQNVISGGNFTVGASNNATDPVISSIFTDGTFISTSAQAESYEFCLFNNVTFNIDAVIYPDLASAKVAHPLAFPNCIEDDPLFVGSLSNYEFRSVSSASPCIGNGKFGANIGGVYEGLVFNESNVQSSTNITFSAGSIGLTNPIIDGQIVWEDSFSRLVTNPFMRLNGVPDFVNNIIRATQSPSPDSPSKLTVSIETKDKTTPYKPIRVYRTGFAIAEDVNGLTSGEDEYHELSIKELRVIGVRVTMTVQA